MTATYDYTISRVVEAPAAKVWAAWTQVDHYEIWFRAVPGSVALDVRPGGDWTATMVAPDGSEHAITGTYREVEENKRLTIAMNVPWGEPSLMGLDLTELDGGTRTEIVLKQSLHNAEERDQAKAGSEILLQWCDEYITAA